MLDVNETSGTSIKRQSGPVTISGSTVTFAPTCPTGGNNGGSAGFTATATTFTLIDNNGNGNGAIRVQVYNKRN